MGPWCLFCNIETQVSAISCVMYEIRGASRSNNSCVDMQGYTAMAGRF
jgi:hypothetical protein